MNISLVILGIVGVLALSGNCKAQDYSTYQQSTQEINRQYHQLEVIRQQQQQYIQQQQLEQMRRESDYRFNQFNRTHDHSHSHQLIR